MLTELGARVGLRMTRHGGCSPLLARILLLAALAGCCATVLYARVYWQFDRVRIKVITTERLSSRGAVVVPLPDLSRLAGFSTAIVLRLENRDLVTRTVTISAKDSELARIALPPEQTKRVDLNVPARAGLTSGDRFELRGDGDGWSLQFLEIANVHGFSHGLFSFLIVPSDTDRYRSAPAIVCLSVFGVLLIVSLPLLRLHENKTIRLTQTALGIVVLLFFFTILVLAAVSEYKLLLSVQAFLVCLAILYSPIFSQLSVLGRVQALYMATLVMFLVSVSSFHRPETGFTSLINFGDQFRDRALPAVRVVAHHVNENSSGYDGQFYAQLAVDPLVRDPAIEQAVDNFSYRARRILFSWTAFLLGLGQPRLILQAYAVQNILCWLVLACLLLRWLPPVDFKNFFLWFGCLFSSGLISSVRFSLLEGPSLLLLALTIVLIERGKPWLAAGLIGLSGLGRETNLLSGACLLERRQLPGRLSGAAVSVARGLMIGLPLTLWLVYLNYSDHGLSLTTGTANVAGPFSGYVGEWGITLSELREAGWTSDVRFSLFTLISLTTQAVVLTLRSDRHAPWWRAGIAYAVLMMFLGPAVWAGYPGAATRVLVPMAVAFNVLLPRSGGFWPLAILGNLSVLHGIEAINGAPV